jgi:hypothetical protein
MSFGFYAQKPVVSLSADTKNVEVGDQITFTVKSNVEGNVEIVFPDEFIEGYGSMNGMEQEMDYNSGTVSTIYYFSKSGVFKENGSYSIYAYVKNRKAIYKSNKLTIKVEKDTQKEQDNGEISSRNLRQAVFGIVQKSKPKIYEGESVVLEAKVYSKLNINMLEAYNSFEVEGSIETKEIDKTSKLLLSRENFKGAQVLTFTYGKQLVFPSSPGKYKIKPFEMTLQYNDGGIFSERISFSSNASSIEVIPLPSGAPNDFIGGVGEFDLTYALNKNKVREADVLVLELTISGAGNLHNTNKPKINLPSGVVIYGDPEVSDEINFGSNGAEGKITYKYNLQFQDSGEKNISAISISYFSPKLKKYITKKGTNLKIEVIPNLNKENQIVLKESDQKQIVESESIPFLTKKDSPSSYGMSSGVFWTSVLSPLFLAFIFGFFYKKNKQKSEIGNLKHSKIKVLNSIQAILRQAEIHCSQTNFQMAFQSLDEALKSLSKLFMTTNESFISKHEVLQILEDHNVNQEVLSKIKSCFIKCEEARYDFDDTSKTIKFEEVVAILKEVLVEINNKK